MILRTALPSQQLPTAYFKLRYEVLRKPLGAARGAEMLVDDDLAIHAWLEDKGRIISVGRVHLLGEFEDGSAYDERAKSACPAFVPLTAACNDKIMDDKGDLIHGNLRAACQFRQMATHPDFRRKQLSSRILKALETEAIKLWSVNSGWLQARTGAIPFYQKNGWSCFGESYEVPNVGLHRSMWKPFT